MSQWPSERSPICLYTVVGDVVCLSVRNTV